MSKPKKPPARKQPTLGELEARYNRQLNKPSPSIRALRKTRDDIIKKRFDMGL